MAKCILIFMLFFGVVCSYATDVRTIKQIGKNGARAMIHERDYFNTHDSILSKRQAELAAILFRVGLKYHDLIERQNLRNFKQENRTYKRTQATINQLLDNVSYLLRAARKNPQNFALFYKNTFNLITTAIESVSKMVRIAMNSKVSTDVSGQPDHGQNNHKHGDDGGNLLTSADRVEMMESCVWELRWLSRAVYRMAVKLDTDVAWTIFFKSATPSHYRKVQAILLAQESAVADIRKLNLFP